MFGPTSAGVHATRPSIGQSRPWLLLRGPRRRGAVFDRRRRARPAGASAGLLRALSDSPLALDTQGTTINLTRVIVFCISAFLAGIFGALYAGFVGSINGTSFPAFNSLTILALVVLVLGGAPWYAITAAAAFQLIPAYVTADNIDTLPPDPLRLRGDRGRAPGPASRHRCRRPSVGSSTGSAGDVPPKPSPAPAPASAPWSSRPRRRSRRPVAAERTRARDRRPHRPLRRPRRGRRPEPRRAARSHHRADRSQRRGQDHDVQRVLRAGPPDPRPDPAPRSRRHPRRLGGARPPRPRPHVPEVGAVAVAHRRGERRARSRGGDGGRQRLPPDHGPSGRRDEIVARRRSTRRSPSPASSRCDTARPPCSRRASGGSSSWRASLAGAFDVILLDEPSSGSIRRRPSASARCSQHVVAERGAGLLLVEHDMALVMDVCEHIYVLDFGRPLFDGSPRRGASQRARAGGLPRVRRGRGARSRPSRRGASDARAAARRRRATATRPCCARCR